MSEADRTKWDARYSALVGGEQGQRCAATSGVSVDRAEHRGFVRDAAEANRENPSSTAAESSSQVLMSVEHYLPRRGRAIDVAGGAGRNGIWLAERGLDVTIADISSVGLELAKRRAERAGVSIATRAIDFDDEPLPPGPWELILSTLFFCPVHFEQFADCLSPGGILIYIQPTMRNLERHDRPPASFLLADGSLPSLVRGLEIMHYDEGWLADARHDALLVARRTDV